MMLRLIQMISIHAPHARSDQSRRVGVPQGVISIHAPHARSDEVHDDLDKGPVISIHAPHARSDSCLAKAMAVASNFNPRSSCEERPVQELDR